MIYSIMWCIICFFYCRTTSFRWTSNHDNSCIKLLLHVRSSLCPHLLENCHYILVVWCCTLALYRQMFLTVVEWHVSTFDNTNLVSHTREASHLTTQLLYVLCKCMQFVSLFIKYNVLSTWICGTQLCYKRNCHFVTLMRIESQRQ